MSLPALARAVVLNAAHSPVSQLLSTLSSESQLLLRKLASLLQTPVDAPAVHAVVASASHVVDSYGKTLVAPTAEFVCILRALKVLKDECDRNGRLLSIACDNPLRRRLTRSPAWALLIQISRLATPEPLRIAAGVELAYCLAIGKPFPNGYATNLRRAISAHDVVCAASGKEVSEPPWRGHFAKATREARKIFESGVPPGDGKDANFAGTVINELRGAALIPSTRHRQALPDHEHLSSTILVAAAERLRRAASDGCDDSLLAIIAFVCGLSLRTTHRVPLFGFSDDPIIELDPSLGVLITDLDLVFTKSARPRANDAHRPACRAIAKPLPLFVARALTKRLTATPDAQCLAHLLPQATCNGSRQALPDQVVGLEASLARFIRSASGFAVGRGVDRLVSAVLFNDFGIIPASKVYYCQVERRELWRAAGHLYDELGWGPPSPYADGIGFGSRVTPTREAVRDWHRWLRDGLEACRPGRNSGIESLLTFHNQFAEACAATTAFCLALRGVARISATADALTPDSKSILVFDKRVGHLPRPLPVPVNAVVAAQAGLWIVHCRTLERRLAGKAVSAGASVRQRLLAVARQERVEMFFFIDKKLRPQPISSHALVRDLPVQFGFDADFGRHFWESELRTAGIGSSDVDLLLRHQVVGIEGHRSTSDKSLCRSFSDVSRVQEELLASLDISPMPGLARK